MPECITVALMFVCNGIGIYVAHKLFSWFENQPADYNIKKPCKQNVRDEKS